MASTSDNLFKRLYENVMGTPEQNKAAAESMKRAEEINKAKKAKEEEEAKKKKMAKGGVVKGFKACDGCPSPAKCKAAGKCMKAKMAKGGTVPPKGKVIKSGSKAAKTGKTPLLVIAVKPKMAKGGAVASKSGTVAKKKAK